MVALSYKKDHVIVNKYSRPGDKLLRVQAIVIHYTANPGANALMHANFFDGADGGGGRYAGAHIFVDKNEALEVIPLDEVGYHANERKAGPLLSALKATASYYPQGNANLLTIGIEMCIEKDGTFHPDTVERTRQVVKMLQAKFPQLADTQNRIVRHYDITGKICPKPFVENQAAWKAFLKSVDQPIKPEPKEAVQVANNKPESTSFPEAQKWVMDNGISDGSNPKAPVTREQLWEMLRRMNAGK
ncbi:N-acetylmuramoyl-L-alanine amidase [Bacillus sp. MCCB 382]|uniref:peptidoglycan recognition protein family protein n=1 Tax=Bacillus sp. MCCB 382 TaxID=2860197 RepID=UPI001C56BE69|nr:N-acetylmuramoyl-L-alanine amidase [Bacillus sp. MCCB 382]